MIRGMHALFYSSEADALRVFLRDKLNLAAADVGGGWLIFNPREADLGVHPMGGKDMPSGSAALSFYCDDIGQTMDDLRARGVEFTQDVEDHGYGLGHLFQGAGRIHGAVVPAKVAASTTPRPEHDCKDTPRSIDRQGEASPCERDVEPATVNSFPPTVNANVPTMLVDV